jgi:hypothetical protein
LTNGAGDGDAAAFLLSKGGRREDNMKRFLNKVLYAKVWELLILLAVIVVVATVYRIYFSRAVALTQVCERLQDLQNDENADAFNSLAGEVGQWLQDVNRICEIRRPIRKAP